MELQSFIAQSLRSIVEGVRDAQKDTKDSGAVIVPELTRLQPRNDAAMVNLGDEHAYAYEIEFDVAVEAATEREAGAKASISVLGAGGRTQSSESHTSRIRFKVPVVLPVQRLEQYRRVQKRKAATRKVAHAMVSRREPWVTRFR